jgi:cytochrome c oxidase subunit IV
MTEASGKKLDLRPDPHDACATSHADDRLCLSIRVVAWVFLISGVSSLVSLILHILVMRRGIVLDFHVLGVFIGRGLLRRREGWLRFAQGYTALLLIMVACVTILSVGIYVGMLAGFVDDTSITWSGPPGLVLLSLLGVWIYLVWQQRVLRRADVRDLFRRAADARAAKPMRRIQFSLGTLLMLAVLAAVVLVQVIDEDVWYERPGGQTLSTTSPDGRRWDIHFAYRSHRFLRKQVELDYVVFFSDQQRNKGLATRWYTFPRTHGTILELPDGTTISLDGDCQLVEYIDGRYRESRERITQGQFQGFLASRPAAYTIDALLRYAKTHPACTGGGQVWQLQIFRTSLPLPPSPKPAPAGAGSVGSQELGPLAAMASELIESGELTLGAGLPRTGK